jgi:hypothetical protein
MAWPDSLVTELAARRCIIFMGAGTSRSATRQGLGGAVFNPPDWLGFLRILRSAHNRGTADDLTLADEFLDQNRYLDCAEILKSTCIHGADYARVLGTTFERYQPTDIHKCIDLIDQKIVVTTNFDTLYEDYCRQGDGASGYIVQNYYDDDIVTRLRSPKRLIVKAHGCVTRPERTVLTRSDFFIARQKHQGFYKVLESLFLTHTLVFIGYSVNDPDIQLLLENSSITAHSDHPHYALMAAGIHPAIRNSFRKTYNIEILEFDPADNYAQFGVSLENLAERVEEVREEQRNE